MYSSASDIFNDVDEIWDQNDEVPAQEWLKMDKEFTNAGYREGITTGKESALQEGFDDGFDNVGAPLGREIGILRGTASAALNVLSSAGTKSSRQPNDSERLKEKLRNIIQGLGRINLEHLAPRDLEAEEHAREHLEKTPFEDIQAVTDQDINGASSSQAVDLWTPSSGKPLTPLAAQELRHVRTQLSETLKDFGLNVALE